MCEFKFGFVTMAQTVYVIIAVYAVSVRLTYACGQQKSYNENERFLGEIEHAENQMLNNIIEFPDYNHGRQSGKPNNFNLDGVIIKAFVGESVNLTCSPEFPIGKSAAEFVEHLTWNHNGHNIPANFSIDPSRFTQTSNSDRSTLQIFPVTYRSAGKFECRQRCLQNPAKLCVQKRYAVVAVPQGVHDVFLEPIQLLRTLSTIELSFSCTLQIECIPSSDPYFIWKYRGMFLAAPEGHFIHRIAPLPSKHQLGVSWFATQYNHSTSNQQTSRNCSETMTLTVQWPDYLRGNIECWARTDPTREQWFVQKKRVC